MSRLPSGIAGWAARLGLALAVSGISAASAQTPARPPAPRPAVATPAPAPTPAQLAVSVAVLRKETRRQAAELRETRDRLERTAKEAANLRSGFVEQRSRLNATESIVTSLMGAAILLGILVGVVLVAAIGTARRLAELESHLENGTAAPAVVRRDLQKMEERLRGLEEEEAFPQRKPAGIAAGANGEGAPAPQHE